jgi:hypothetical protein
MKGVIALALLVAGVCVSATSGSLLGGAEGHRAELKAQQAVTGSFVAALTACDETATEAMGEPEQSASDLAAIEQTQLGCRVGVIRGWDTDLAESDRTDAQLAAEKSAEISAAISEVQALNAEAEAAIDAMTMLAPGLRFMEWFGKGGVGWLLGLVLVGAVLGRQDAYARATAPTHGSSDTPNFDDAVVTLLAATAQMKPLVAATEDGDDCAEARAIIETLEATVLAPVVDDRGRYQARDGVAVFAEYFGPFSAGERNLARAWSSLTDGYPHVAADALVAATTAFEQAAAAYAKRND